MDLLLALLSWVEAAVSVHGLGSGASSARALRSLRVVRLLRLSRMMTGLELLRWKIQSEMLMLSLGILKNVLGILMLAHFVACFWYGISLTNNGSAARFVEAIQAESGLAPSFGACYAWSIQWALMQFTGLGLHVSPHLENGAEVMYGILMMLFTFVISACFLSLITTSMTRFSRMNDHATVQSSMLRKYLHDNGISGQLAASVQRSAQHAAAEMKKNVPEGDIELLTLVSKPLRIELHFELHSPHLTRHPFFMRFEERSPAALRQICHRAVTPSFVSPNDIIFSFGEIPVVPSMYFITKGTAQYISGLDQFEKDLFEGDTLCEAFLWTSWSFVGTLLAVTECKLLSLDAQAFQKLAIEFTPGPERMRIQLYAREFTGHLNTLATMALRDTLSGKQLRIFAARAFGANEKRRMGVDGSCGITDHGGFGGRKSVAEVVHNVWQRLSTSSMPERERAPRPFDSSPVPLDSSLQESAGSDAERGDTVGALDCILPPLDASGPAQRKSSWASAGGGTPGGGGGGGGRGRVSFQEAPAVALSDATSFRGLSSPDSEPAFVGGGTGNKRVNFQASSSISPAERGISEGGALKQRASLQAQASSALAARRGSAGSSSSGNSSGRGVSFMVT